MMTGGVALDSANLACERGDVVWARLCGRRGGVVSVARTTFIESMAFG